MKPENILLDSNFDVKIADFGFATPLEANTRHGMNTSRVGTMGYMAPEILARSPYQGNMADLFALGVILFIMYVGHPPFNVANEKDAYFALLNDNNSAKFWRAHERLRSDITFSPSFKNLITLLLQPLPFQRPGLADIIAHEWMMEGDCATSAEAQFEMAKRLEHT